MRILRHGELDPSPTVVGRRAASGTYRVRVQVSDDLSPLDSMAELWVFVNSKIPIQTKTSHPSPERRSPLV